MARQLSRPGLPNYGAMSEDPEVMFGGENRDLRVLCDNISTNVYTINSSVRNLQSAYSSFGTARDTQGLRDQVHVWQLSANQVVKATTADVAKLANLARSANKVQKLQADKITNHFKEAVQAYSKTQLLEQDLELDSWEQRIRVIERDGGTWLQAVADKLRSSLPRAPVLEEDQSPLLEAEERQQLQLQQELQFEAELLVEREQRIQVIESDILDVNQLMRELGAIVHEQSAVIDSIEGNIESARGNVESGASELRTAANLQNKARKRNLFLLLLLVAVLAVLIGIIVWSSR